MVTGIKDKRHSLVRVMRQSCPGMFWKVTAGERGSEDGEPGDRHKAEERGRAPRQDRKDDPSRGHRPQE